MINYVVESKSRGELRALARELREWLGLENVMRMPIVELLDVLPECIDGFSYEIVSDSELPESVHAETDVRTGHITIKESVYNGACEGKGRDRMTIAHEIAHYITICLNGFKLQRNFDHHELKPYEDPEWQAKCFAGEFMIDRYLTRDMSPQEIAERCGVSLEAAKYQQKFRQ